MSKKSGCGTPGHSPNCGGYRVGGGVGNSPGSKPSGAKP